MRQMRVTDLHLEADAAYFDKALKQEFSSSHLNFKDCIHLTSDNEKLVVDISVSEILYKRKRQRLVIALDITEQREAEEKAISAIIEEEDGNGKELEGEFMTEAGNMFPAATLIFSPS